MTALRRVPVWVLPLAIALLSFVVTGIDVVSDGSLYMSWALNIAHGRGYLDAGHAPVVIRGPGFPAILALGLLVFGESAKGAFLVSRIFYVLNVLLVFVIGKRLFGGAVGLTASLLIATSGSLGLWSTLRHLDHVWPFFMLSYLLLLTVSLEKGDRRLFAASGLVLGFAYLIKEMTLIYVPLPLLALWLIRSDRRRPNAIGIAISGVVFAALSLPWSGDGGCILQHRSVRRSSWQLLHDFSVTELRGRTVAGGRQYMGSLPGDTLKEGSRDYAYIGPTPFRPHHCMPGHRRLPGSPGSSVLHAVIHCVGKCPDNSILAHLSQMRPVGVS